MKCKQYSWHHQYGSAVRAEACSRVCQSFLSSKFLTSLVSLSSGSVTKKVHGVPLLPLLPQTAAVLTTHGRNSASINKVHRLHTTISPALVAALRASLPQPAPPHTNSVQHEGRAIPPTACEQRIKLLALYGRRTCTRRSMAHLPPR